MKRARDEEPVAVHPRDRADVRVIHERLGLIAEEGRRLVAQAKLNNKEYEELTDLHEDICYEVATSSREHDPPEWIDALRAAKFNIQQRMHASFKLSNRLLAQLIQHNQEVDELFQAFVHTGPPWVPALKGASTTAGLEPSAASDEVYEDVTISDYEPVLVSTNVQLAHTEIELARVIANLAAAETRAAQTSTNLAAARAAAAEAATHLAASEAQAVQATADLVATIAEVVQVAGYAGKMMDNVVTRLEHAEAEPDGGKRRPIPKKVRTDVWDVQFGAAARRGGCHVCGTDIDVLHFTCGHVIAHARGGSDTVDNLRPVCAPCNLSMGQRDMEEYKRAHYGTIS